MQFISDVLRVAVASSQGCRIDLNFGDVDQFLIFDVRKDAVEFIESRIIPLQDRILDFFMDSDDFDPAVESIRDCQIVVSSETGNGVQEQLLARGIHPLEMACSLVSGLVKVRGLLAA